jgi:hypothetical protein
MSLTATAVVPSPVTAPVTPPPQQGQLADLDVLIRQLL